MPADAKAAPQSGIFQLPNVSKSGSRNNYNYDISAST